MADFSLDEYIEKKGIGKTSNVKRAAGFQLGATVKPGFRFTNVSAPGPNKPTPFAVPRVRLPNNQAPTKGGPVIDARQKLQLKTKFGDARQRIQIRKQQKETGIDMRLKIQAKRALMQMNTMQSSVVLGPPFASQQRSGLPLQNPPAFQPQMPFAAFAPRPTTIITIPGVRIMSPNPSTIVRVGSAGGGGMLRTFSTNPQQQATSVQQLNVISAQPTNSRLKPPPIMSAPTNRQAVISSQSVGRMGLQITARNDFSRPLLSTPNTSNPLFENEFRPVIRFENDLYQRPIPTLLSRTTQPLQQPITMATDNRKQAPPPTADIVSPLQGFRTIITNLHANVTQDDIVELFGAVGAMKRARLLKPGTAEVVFVNHADALTAVQKYHMRELDGQPMSVVLSGGVVNAPPKSLMSGKIAAQNSQAFQPLKLGASAEAITLDPGIIHQALFRAVESEAERPVSFTVKL